MLKKRVIPVLLLRDGRMQKGINFGSYRDTGSPTTAVRVYSAQDADELIFLNIAGGSESNAHLIEVIREAAIECFMPLTAGGGIRTLADAEALISAGADKIIITSAATENTSLITDVAERYGVQCVVAGIDYRLQNGVPCVWAYCGTRKTSLDLLEYALQLEASGAGEIFLNSIDCDGTMEGYDIATAKKIASLVTVPVIMSGGAGNFMHIAELLSNTRVSAAACGSIFHFGDNNPIRARSYLKNLGISMRKLR
jgi:cyclase